MIHSFHTINTDTITSLAMSTPICAPSKNLNVGYPHFKTAAEMYSFLREVTQPGGEFVVRNFVGVIEDISVAASTV